MEDNKLNNIRLQIGKLISDRREELNLSQQDLADKTTYKLATIKAIEQGKFWIDLKQYIVICSILNFWPQIDLG